MSDSPLELLISSFDGIEPRLQAAIATYLTTGSPVDLPGLLGEHDRAQLATLHSRVRAPFYVALDRLDRGDDAVLVRLGRLLAVLGADHLKTPHAPASIRMLLADVASAMGSTRAPLNSLTIDRVRGLLASEGVIPSALDGIIVDLLIGSISLPPAYPPRGLQTVPGIAEFATEHAGLVIGRAASFDDTQFGEIGRLACDHPPFASAIAPVLIARAVAGTLEARTAAFAAISVIPAGAGVDALAAVLAATAANDRARVIPVIERLPDVAAAIGLLEAERGRRPAPALADELVRAVRRLQLYGTLPTAPAVPQRDPYPDEPVATAAADGLRRQLAGYLARLDEKLPRLRAERTEFLRLLDETQYQYPGNELEYTEGLHTAAADALGAFPEIVSYLEGMGRHPGDTRLDAVLWAGAQPVGLAPVHRIRLAARVEPNRYRGMPLGGVRDVPDARLILDVLMRSGCTQAAGERAIVESYLTNSWETPALNTGQLGGYLLEHPRTFDNVLGLSVGPVPVPHADQRTEVLDILATLPELPRRYAAYAGSIAVGTGKTNRRAAQRVLERHGIAEPIAVDLLGAVSAEQRTVAIEWIRSIGGSWAIETLVAHLAAEQEPAVRARTIAALETLGADISQQLRPDVLLAEAEGGNAQRAPASAAWIPLDDAPAARYRDGTRVPGDVIRWWIVLAARLKDPLGAGLLPRYLRSLDPATAATLSRWILTLWIARDTTPLDDATVLSRAMAQLARHERRMQQVYVRYPELEEGVDELFERFDAERQAIATASTTAIADKGLLALAGAVPGPELAETVRQYMRREHLKRAQIEALMHVLASSDDTEPLQLLVATGRRYRTASVQETARGLVELVAERRGWTADELADRMIPNAGLGDDRTMALDFGQRRFTARLGADLALHLESEDGAPLKALPAPRADEEGAASAKAELAAARKELKALVTVQRRRLYDAMCTRREWTTAQWRELLLEHPVMGVLVTGLIWQSGSVLFRPGLDGVLRDAAGATVEPGHTVSIAHPTTVHPEQASGWSMAEVSVGFDQFRAQPVPATDDVRRTDREGRPGGTFRLRGRARRLEWDHGPTGDDVRFDEYIKTFPTAGLQAVVTFSGSQLPESDQPIEFGVLTVRALDERGRVTGEVQFSEVPDALRAEIVADYLELGE